MLQLELILLCCSFISVVFRARSPSRSSFLPLASSPVFSYSPWLCYFRAIPSRSPWFPSSWTVPAHQQTSCYCRSSAKGALGPSAHNSYWGYTATREMQKGTRGLVTADCVQSTQFPGATTLLTHRRLDLWCVLCSMMLRQDPTQACLQLSGLTPCKMGAHLLGEWNFPKV